MPGLGPFNASRSQPVVCARKIKMPGQKNYCTDHIRDTTFLYALLYPLKKKIML